MTETKKARFAVDDVGAVLLTADYGFGERITRRFYVRSDTDLCYVREGDNDPNDRQVCEFLSSQGVTLMSTKAGLLDTIRFEWRRLREWLKREELLY